MATALVALAALNTGNNLIYLVLASMLASLLCSALLPLYNLRGLKASAWALQPLFAKRPCSLRIRIESPRRLPAYSIHVVGPGGLRLRFARIKGSEEATARVKFARRGLYQGMKVRLQSSFPSIFFVASVEVPLEGHLLVYPELRDLGPWRPAPRGRGGPRPLLPGEEPQSLRPYVPGDDTRRISWKALARHQSLLVKDTRQEPLASTAVVLDGTGPPSEEAFEECLSLAASVAKRLLEEGHMVALLTAQDRVPFGSGPAQLWRILEVLALAEEPQRWQRSLQGMEAGVLILKSRASALSRRAQEFGHVIYASYL
jgi:uncharacterized protein (DUF58 family)